MKCRQCQTDFEPTHHAVKYCDGCRHIRSGKPIGDCSTSFHISDSPLKPIMTVKDGVTVALGKDVRIEAGVLVIDTPGDRPLHISDPIDTSTLDYDGQEFHEGTDPC